MKDSRRTVFFGMKIGETRETISGQGSERLQGGQVGGNFGLVFFVYYSEINRDLNSLYMSISVMKDQS